MEPRRTDRGMRSPAFYLTIGTGGIMAIGIAPVAIWWLYKTRGAIGLWNGSELTDTRKWGFLFGPGE
jgi:hypothetical protein